MTVRQALKPSSSTPAQQHSPAQPASAPDARILLFSGGSATSRLARALKQHTRASIHLVTAFDSGGSSGTLRQHFRMPAVGDLRARLIALCNEDDPRTRALAEVLDYRFEGGDQPLPLTRHALPRTRSLLAARPELTGSDLAGELLSLLAGLPDADEFDLRGASLGNLVLTAAYLQSGRRLAPACELLSGWLDLRGMVRCTADRDLQLSARLRDGRVLVGQHAMTGKETPPISAPIESIWLSDRRGQVPAQPCRIDDEIAGLITSADLIVYPPGSFFSSLLVHLLPEGVSQAIAACPAPKVYVPNLGADPESLGLAPAVALQRLIDALTAGAPRSTPQAALLSDVLLDQGQADDFRESAQSLRWHCTPLRDASGNGHDAGQLCQALLQLTRTAALSRL